MLNQHLIRKIAPLVIMALSVIVLTGCVNFLEDDVLSITEHQAPPFIRPPVEQISVSNPDELKTELLRLINEHETNSQLIYFIREGEDVQSITEQVSEEILSEHPLGAFAVEEITSNVTRIVTHYEVDIEIVYKQTQEYMDSIINVSAERGVINHLREIMSQYRPEVLFRTGLQLTEEEITELVSRIYYQNPRLIVMLPIITVEMFPEVGTDRIYQIRFGYSETADMLLQFGELLEAYVLRNASEVVGNTESEILLSLVESLMGWTNYDDEAGIHFHGAQNLAATAYGALVRGSAVGEGFAMAFKALADELGFECIVVLGEYKEQIHAWNIVSLYGEYYHLDVAMCVVEGIEDAFLKTDAEFEEMLYTWDMENTVRCEGELTLDDIRVPEPDDPDEINDENGEITEEE